MAPDRRPGLSQALARLEDPADPAQVLITAKLDRLGRDTRDILNLADRARAGGWRLVLLDLDIDSSTPAGGLMLTVMAAIAEFERRVISERTTRALAELKAQGATLGRPVELEPSTAERILDLRGDGPHLPANRRPPHRRGNRHPPRGELVDNSRQGG